MIFKNDQFLEDNKSLIDKISSINERKTIKKQLAFHKLDNEALNNFNSCKILNNNLNNSFQNESQIFENNVNYTNTSNLDFNNSSFFTHYNFIH